MSIPRLRRPADGDHPRRRVRSPAGYAPIIGVREIDQVGERRDRTTDNEEHRHQLHLGVVLPDSMPRREREHYQGYERKRRSVSRAMMSHKMWCLCAKNATQKFASS
jgi:hypothetical protein